jgi:hypothetical protein
MVSKLFKLSEFEETVQSFTNDVTNMQKRGSQNRDFKTSYRKCPFRKVKKQKTLKNGLCASDFVKVGMI